MTFQGGKVGLHRPYFDKDTYRQSNPSSIAENQARIMRRLREFLLNEGMATDLIEKMMKHSSRAIYWVDGLEWMEKVPNTAPWYEETLIAQCNARPDYFVSLNRIIFDANSEEERRNEAIKRQQEYSRSLAQCENALIQRSQQEFRRTFAPKNTGAR
jgi:hypothetical protein